MFAIVDPYNRYWAGQKSAGGYIDVNGEYEQPQYDDWSHSSKHAVWYSTRSAAARRIRWLEQRGWECALLEPTEEQ